MDYNSLLLQTCCRWGWWKALPAGAASVLIPEGTELPGREIGCESDAGKARWQTLIGHPLCTWHCDQVGTWQREKRHPSCPKSPLFLKERGAGNRCVSRGAGQGHLHGPTSWRPSPRSPACHSHCKLPGNLQRGVKGGAHALCWALLLLPQIVAGQANGTPYLFPWKQKSLQWGDTEDKLPPKMC